MLLRAEEFYSWWRRCRSIEVRPFGGDKRFAPVRQDEYELQAVRHARLAKDLERLAVKRMIRAGDGDAFGKVPMMGSVWRCFLTASVTNNSTIGVFTTGSDTAHTVSVTAGTVMGLAFTQTNSTPIVRIGVTTRCR